MPTGEVEGNDHTLYVWGRGEPREPCDDPANAAKRKELLLDSAAMHHFLGNDAAAKGELNDALKSTFEDAKLSAGQNKNVNNNLEGLIKEYLERIDNKTVPKDDGTDKEDDPAPQSTKG